jgi:hypothetical protein
MEMISRDDGTWEMSRVQEIEFLMLGKLVEALDPSGSEAALRRLYPSPLPRPAMDDEEDEFVADWATLVRPDLEVQFRSAVEVVQGDLAGMKGVKRNGQILYHLTVPKKHADDWCSALNQARLVLHERFDLPDEDEPLDESSGHEQWLAMVQSEIYGNIMEFLVRKVLWLK